ncbi:unnamed protein product, partial [Sphagnum jensenii]
IMTFLNIWFSALLFPGLFLPINDIVYPFRILSYILPLRYAFRSIIYQEFHNSIYNGAELCSSSDSSCITVNNEQVGYKCQNTQITCYGYTGYQVLHSISYQFSVITNENHFIFDILILVTFSIICKFLYMIIMVIK